MSDTEIKVINAEKGDGKLTVKKAFTAGQAGAPNAPQGVEAPKFKFKFTKAPEGSGLLNTTFELAVGEEKPFANLPYGTYAVTEDGNADFTVTGDKEVTLSIADKDKTITLTNTPKKGETDFTAVKKWVGGKAEDHKKVTLTLLADGQEVTQAPAPTVTPAAEPADEYTYKWTGLPNYYNNGAKIKYSVEERNVPEGYAATYNADHTEVTNTNQKEGEINVNKTWTGPEPNVSEIKIRLLKDGQPVPGGEITLKKADGWKGKFEFLDKDLSKYTVEEQEPVTNNWVGNGGKVKVGDVEYDVNIKGTGTSSVNITNAGPDGGLTVRKEWKGAAPTQTTEITVQLLKNNVEVPGKTLTLKASESWTGKFEYLEGDLKEYSVKEVGVTPEGTVEIDGKTYKVTVDASQAAQGKITVTNSHDAGETLTVVKKWIGTAPVNDLIVKLYKGNVDTGKELTLKASENWTGQVTGLEKPLSQYTVKEKDDDDNFKGDGETAKVSGKEYKVKVLTHLINQGKIGIENTPKGDKTLTVKKEWKGEAGSTVTLYLVKDGAVTSDFITLNAGNKWTDKFENLEGPVSRYSLQELDEASGNPVGSGATVTLGGKTYTFTVDTRKLTRGELKAINTQTGAGGGGGTPPSPTPHPHWYPDF